MELETNKMLARIEDGIGWVTFNQPEKRNAISLEMWAALGEILEAFHHDPRVHEWGGWSSIRVRCGYFRV
jgi:enoyl-CoA hydratase